MLFLFYSYYFWDEGSLVYSLGSNTVLSILIYIGLTSESIRKIIYLNVTLFILQIFQKNQEYIDVDKQYCNYVQSTTIEIKATDIPTEGLQISQT